MSEEEAAEVRREKCYDRKRRETDERGEGHQERAKDKGKRLKTSICGKKKKGGKEKTKGRGRAFVYSVKQFMSQAKHTQTHIFPSK